MRDLTESEVEELGRELAANPGFRWMRGMTGDLRIFGRFLVIGVDGAELTVVDDWGETVRCGGSEPCWAELCGGELYPRLDDELTLGALRSWVNHDAVWELEHAHTFPTDAHRLVAQFRWQTDPKPVDRDE